MSSVQRTLDDLRASLGGCRLTAFVDLQSQLVLSHSAAERHAQESLDDLAAAAARMLALDSDAKADVQLLGALPDEALTLTAADTTLFLRSPVATTEALVCICPPTAVPEELLRAAAGAIRRIAAADVNGVAQEIEQPLQ